MAKDIANLSDPDQAAFNSALKSMGYLVPLSSITISEPTPYIDFVLPSDCRKFTLEIFDLTLDAVDFPAIALSYDGVTYFDAEATVVNVFFPLNSSDPTATQGYTYVGHLSALDQQNTQSGQSGDFDVTILPGSVTRAAIIDSWAHPKDLPAAFWANQSTSSPSDPEDISHTTAMLGRVVGIRLQPGGNGDANPPTSGRNFTGGSIILRGA